MIQCIVKEGYILYLKEIGVTRFRRRNTPRTINKDEEWSYENRWIKDKKMNSIIILRDQSNVPVMQHALPSFKKFCKKLLFWVWPPKLISNSQISNKLKIHLNNFKSKHYASLHHLWVKLLWAQYYLHDLIHFSDLSDGKWSFPLFFTIPNSCFL